MAYFNADLLPKPQNSYVCFIDIMGVQNKMKHSLPQTGNYIFKLHATILYAWRNLTYDSISVYPIMDGAYIVSNTKDEMLTLLATIFYDLSVSLLNEPDFKYWYLVRAAISYGEIIHGRNIPYDASLEFSSRVGYKEQLLIGPAMIDAYTGEGKAAPMGIYVADSATDINREWKWFDHSGIKVDLAKIDAFKNSLKEYYSVWLEQNESITKYPENKRNEHFQLAIEYFGIK